MARRKHSIVQTGQLVSPVDLETEEPPGGDSGRLFSVKGLLDPATRSERGGYWAQVRGLARSPTANSAAYQRQWTNDWSASARDQRAGNGAGTTYGDQATGLVPRHPTSAGDPRMPAWPGAAAWVGPHGPRAPSVTTEDSVAREVLCDRAEPAPVHSQVLPNPQPGGRARGAHVSEDDPLAREVRATHVRADDPLAGAAWELCVSEDDVLAVQVQGAHAKADDALAVGRHVHGGHAKVDDPLANDTPETQVCEVVALDVEADRAMKTEAPVPPPAHGKPTELECLPVKGRSRRWRWVPVSGAAAALAAGLGGGSAYAYFSASGSGTGQASIGSPADVVFGQPTIGTVSSHLVPGDTGDLFVKVDNPNPYAVRITGIQQNGLVSVVASGDCTSDTGTWPGSVTLGNSGVSVPTNDSLNISIPANSGPSIQIDLPNAVSMTTGSASACQGATFQIPVTVTVRTP